MMYEPDWLNWHSVSIDASRFLECRAWCICRLQHGKDYNWTRLHLDPAVYSDYGSTMGFYFKNVQDAVAFKLANNIKEIG